METKNTTKIIEKFATIGKYTIMSICDYDGTLKLDIRVLFSTNDSSTGWTKKGVRFSVAELEKLQKLFPKIIKNFKSAPTRRHLEDSKR